MKYRLMSFLMCGLVVSTITVGFAADDQRETPLVRAVKRASPSVVNIHTEKTTIERDTVFNTGSSKPRKVNGMGTGVVIDERGYIVTNYHVIADVDLIRATFEDNTQADARTVAFDRDHDLALIRVSLNKPLKVMPSGTSSDLMLGEDVIAVGNAFGYSHTVTKGIISSLGRDVEVNDTQSYKNLIQTDASINPGNSGGPLLNLNGEVVGINVAIRAGAQRIGFAIPIDDARRIVARLISVEQLNHNYHGAVVKDVKAGATRKLVVDSVLPESPAAKAGLKSGDVIVKLADRDIVDAVDWERACLDRKVDEPLNVVVRRGEATENVQMALAAYIGGRSRLQPEIVARANNENNEADRFWRVLGVRVSTLPTDKAGVVPAKYRGGLIITEVRAQSPAALNGIKKDDILVGLRDWETLSIDNITWILNQPMTAGQSGMKFLVIRGQETLYGHLQVAGLDAKATTTR